MLDYENHRLKTPKRPLHFCTQPKTFLKARNGGRLPPQRLPRRGCSRSPAGFELEAETEDRQQPLAAERRTSSDDSSVVNLQKNNRGSPKSTRKESIDSTRIDRNPIDTRTGALRRASLPRHSAPKAPPILFLTEGLHQGQEWKTRTTTATVSKRMFKIIRWLRTRSRNRRPPTTTHRRASNVFRRQFCRESSQEQPRFIEANS